jgi:2,4-dienoyl-CoA reductase (NADPH2)
LFEKNDRIGGQLNLANQIPGKEEFNETLRYFRKQLDLCGVHVHLNRRVTAEKLLQGRFDEIILATGVTPRIPDIEGIDHSSVLSYVDVLLHRKEIGQRVAIVGAGGIGFDVAHFITQPERCSSLDRDAFLKEWGVDRAYRLPGGLMQEGPHIPASGRQVYLLQRKKSKIGKSLGKTTGWIHRLILKRRNVIMINAVSYRKIDDDGLHVTLKGNPQILEVDTVIICAGQESKRGLKKSLENAGMAVHLIGGSADAVELDAKRAIDQGARLAAAI